MTSRGELLERDAEMAVLTRLLDAAEAGEGGVVLVEGEAGIGKSTLLAAGAEQAATRGFLVLRARGGELEQDLPFGVARQLLASRARDGVVAAESGAHEEMYWLVDELAAARPVLLCVDDAHWADAESVRWLVYLGRRLAGVRAAVVVGWRPGETGSVHEALRAQSTALAPALLSAQACAALVRAVRPDADAAACHRASGGNPFLLTELLREGGGLRDAETTGPERVRSSVRRRLALLPPFATDVARAVAVLSADASPSSVAQLGDLPVADVLLALGDLQRCGLLATDLPPRFTHPMLRSAVYVDIPSAHRARAHVRAARVLAADPPRAAVHLLASPPTGDAWSVECLCSAAAAALDAGAAGSAAALLRRALDDDPPDRAAVLLSLGHAERLLGRDESARHLRAAIELATRPDDRVRAAIELGQAMGTAGRTAESVPLLEAVLDDLPDPYTADGQRLAAILLANAVNVGVDHHRLAARVAALVDGNRGATALLADVLLGYHVRQADIPFAALAGLAARAATGDITGSDIPLGIWQIGYHFGVDDLDTAESLVERGLATAKQDGGLVAQAFLAGVQAALHLRRGTLWAAETAGRSALDLARAAALPRLSAVGFLLPVLVQRGDLGGAEAVLSEHGLSSADPPHTSHGAVLLAERAALRLAQNRRDQARADAVHALARWRARDSRGMPGGARLVLAEICRRDGDRAAAGAHAAEEWEIACNLGLPSLSAVALAARGVIDGGEDGLAMLAEAAAALDTSPCRLRLARVLVEYGSALRRARRSVDARDVLARACDIAHRGGAGPLADRAHTELLATGARPRRRVRSGIDALTVAERRVVWLAADGRSNQEIAQELFVTRRTVETHLSAAYRKLGISRAELPDWRAEHA